MRHCWFNSQTVKGSVASPAGSESRPPIIGATPIIHSYCFLLRPNCTLIREKIIDFGIKVGRREGKTEMGKLSSKDLAEIFVCVFLKWRLVYF